MIFTSASIPSSASATPLFKQKGNTNGYPGPVSASGVFGFPTRINKTFEFYKTSLPQQVIATFVKAGASFGAVFSKTEGFAIPNPPIALSFDRISQDTEQKLSLLGFTRDTFGKQPYYRGPFLPGNAGLISGLGSKTKVLSPLDCCDLNGMHALTVANRIIYAAISTIHKPAYSETDEFDFQVLLRQQRGDEDLVIETDGILPLSGAHATAPSKGWWMVTPILECLPTIKKSPVLHTPREIKTALVGYKGVFLPYFSGMSTKDTTFIPNLLINRFPTLLGNNSDAVLETVSVITKGWSSASGTEPGKILSHMAFCLDLALNTGTKPIVYMKADGTYHGIVLYGDNFTIVAKGQVMEPLSRDDLYKEVKEFDSHDSAIEKIAGILSSMSLLTATAKTPAEEGAEAGEATEAAPPPQSTVEVTAELLKTPRIIHNLLRSLNHTEDNRKQLRKQFGRMSFTQTFYDPRDVHKISQFLITTAKGEFLDDSAPINYMDPSVMFTRACDLSFLGAFGPQGPSFVDPQGESVPILRKGKKGSDSHLLINQKNSKGAHLLPQGRIPVFIKDTDDALSDYRAMKKNHIISFRVTTRGGVAGCSVDFKGGQAEALSNILAAHYSPGEKIVVEKRKRDVADMDVDELDKEVKRVKLKSDVMKKVVSFSSQLWAEAHNATEEDAMDDD
jgi:hypothetical protein